MKESNLNSNQLFDSYHSYHQEKINLLIKDKLNNRISNSLKQISIKNKTKNSHLRYLIRESGTEPLIRILVEGKDKVEVNKEIKFLVNQVENILND